MSYAAVLPSVYQLWTDRCWSTMSDELKDNLILVDNTSDNLGVAGSWNLGVNKVLNGQLDWLVIISAAVRFGMPGGKDFIELLDVKLDRIALEAAHGIGWHLIAFRREVFEKVGLFDENFYPAYYEDIDFGRRVSLGFDLDPPYWEKVSVDVAIAGFAHGINLGHVQASDKSMLGYYTKKWGDKPGYERWNRPFGDKELSWWPQK